MTEPIIFDELEETDPAPSRVDGGRQAGGRALAAHHRRRSPWSRVLRWMAIGVVVAIFVQEGVSTYYERKLTETAVAVTGRPEVDVRCGRFWDFAFDLRGSANDGFVYFDTPTANLQLPVCVDAARWADNPTDDDARWGLHVLAHELAHVAGHVDESKTECVAMWATPRVAVSLGGTEEEGRVSAEWYQGAVNPTLMPEYRAPGCLSGSAPRSPLLR